jgi:hypothetical protein
MAPITNRPTAWPYVQLARRSSVPIQDKQRHLNEVVRPLQERPEPVYVVEGSDAEAVARLKFKNKTVKTVASGLRPRTISGLLNFMPFVFQPNQSRGLDAAFHFTFTGAEEHQATITIRNCTLDINDGLLGKADVHVIADAKTWLGFLASKSAWCWPHSNEKFGSKATRDCSLRSANVSRPRAPGIGKSRSCLNHPG